METYENKETEERIRALLNGKYANTAFCLLDPQGQRQLTRSGRSPSQVIGGRRGIESNGSNETIIREMNRIASRFRQRGEDRDTVLQDFLSFGQALNVASADQRLLVFVDADEAAIEEVTPTLQALHADQEILGRFHFDFVSAEDNDWQKSVKGSRSKSAINVIQAGKFGLDGEVLLCLALDTPLHELKAKLLAQNEMFAAAEERKIYSEHVMQGKRAGIKYETEIPYGEDRDGDGEIDQKARRGGAGNDNTNLRRLRGPMRPGDRRRGPNVQPFRQ